MNAKDVIELYGVPVEIEFKGNIISRHRDLVVPNVWDSIDIESKHRYVVVDRQFVIDTNQNKRKEFRAILKCKKVI